MPAYLSFHNLVSVDQGNGRTIVRGDRLAASETLTVGGAAVNSTASPAGPAFIIARIATSEACRIETGVAAVADASSEYWPAGYVEDVVIPAGARVSAIQV